MPMHSPSRPGAMVGKIIADLGDTIAGAARRLGVPRQTLHRLIHNKNASLTPEMAVRLQIVFGGTAHHWLMMQANYDAAQIKPRAAAISKGLKLYPPPDSPAD